MSFDVIHWAVVYIATVLPPGVYSKETPEAAALRYEAIAKQVVEVAFAAKEKPLYEGPAGRLKTMAVMLAIDAYESGFRKDIDEGVVRGDGGGSWCLAQVNTAGGRIVVKDDGSFDYSSTEGWTGADLVADRHKCFRAQLAIMRASFQCEHRTEEASLMKYASGKCDAGYRESYHRMKAALKLFGSAEGATDADVRP